MKLLEVGDNPKLKSDFLEVPLGIYKDYQNWIRPLNDDIDSVFDPKKNKLFLMGSAIRWVLVNDKNELIGRIAAFINGKTSANEEVPTGGIGFFECINNKEAAFLLLNKAREWLVQNKMEAVDGPINFGDRDRWWGLLIEGDYAPNYCCNYNPPYYQSFFEDFGFQIYFKQFTYYRRVDTPLDPRVIERSDRIEALPGLSFTHLRRKDLVKFTEDFRTVYNKAWVNHGVPEMSKSQAIGLMRQLDPIMDERIIWFAYHNDDPIAFFVMLPEINQLIRYANGKLDWKGKLAFIWNKWLGKNTKMLGLVFGVVPEWQGKGIESALVINTAKKVQNGYVKYQELEMNWIGDFNPKMIRITRLMGGEVRKTHATYRLFFDGREVERHKPI